MILLTYREELQEDKNVNSLECSLLCVQLVT